MAEVNQREYVIPLRKEWMKVPRYKRTSKSVKAIKEFVAKHMKVPERDLNKVKLDVYLNNELWFRGMKKPPAKVKVLAKKDGEIVRVEMAEVPEMVKFLKARHERRHKKSEKKEKKEEVKPSATEEETSEKKENEKEKSKSVEQAQTKALEKSANVQKHTVQTQKGPQIQRKALKK